MSLVELVRCGSSMEAAILQSALEAEGIDSFVFDAEMSWIGGALQCRLMVDDDDLAQARRVLPDQPSR
ncbi:MAG: putative signal transducing protein [Allosphingosinicella sp.]